MHSAIDIDGTIGYRNERDFLLACNESFHLRIDPVSLDTLSYRQFLHRPELLAYREYVGEDAFQLAFGWLDMQYRVVMSALPMTGSVEGIHLLAKQGPVTYFTACSAFHIAERSMVMAGTAHQWLREQTFPSPEQVVSYQDLTEKLLHIAGFLKGGETMLLIDDHYELLLHAITALAQPIQDMLRRQLILGAYKAHTAPQECYGVRVLPFPSWHQIDGLLDSSLLGAQFDRA